MIREDTKSLNLSNEDAKHRTVWSSAKKPKKLIKHADLVHPPLWILDVKRLVGRYPSLYDSMLGIVCHNF